MNEWKELLGDAAVRGARYLEAIADRSVSPGEPEIEKLQEFVVNFF